MLVTLLGMVKEVGEEQPCIRVLVAVSIIALQLSRLSYIGLPSSTTILVNESQPENAASPMLVTFLGIKTLVNKEHLENANCLMLVTLLGMVIEVGEEQPFIRVLVAVSIIALQLSRLSYIGLPSSTVILVNEVQPPNTASPMLVTLFGIKILVNEEQPKNARPLILSTPSEITMLVNEEQPSKALFPIIFTLLGITTLVNEEQPEKAKLPIRFILSGITTLVNEEQSEKAQLPMFVTLSGIIIVVKEEQPKNALLGISRVPFGMMATPSLISNLSIVFQFIS